MIEIQENTWNWDENELWFCGREKFELFSREFLIEVVQFVGEKASCKLLGHIPETPNKQLTSDRDKFGTWRSRS
jgi:hypothetical protein